MSNASFWQKDQTEISRFNQQRALLREKIDLWQRLYQESEEAKILVQMAFEEEDESTLQEVNDDVDQLEKEIKDLELQSLLGDADDKRNAILAINAGAGGTEAQDWVEMLLRMFIRWSENKGMKVQMLDHLPGDEAGIKSVTFTVTGPYAYGHLKSEHGIHRMVRICPFDATGR